MQAAKYRAECVNNAWSVTRFDGHHTTLVCVCGTDLEEDGRHQRDAHTIALLMAAHDRVDPLPHD